MKPVPPVLFGIAQKSKDHTYAGYTERVLPMFATMNPAPKVRLVAFEAGYHSYTRPEPGLPMGLGPAVVQLWHDAIMGGFYGGGGQLTAGSLADTLLRSERRTVEIAERLLRVRRGVGRS